MPQERGVRAIYPDGMYVQLHVESDRVDNWNRNEPDIAAYRPVGKEISICNISPTSEGCFVS